MSWDIMQDKRTATKESHFEYGGHHPVTDIIATNIY